MDGIGDRTLDSQLSAYDARRLTLDRINPWPDLFVIHEGPYLRGVVMDQRSGYTEMSDRQLEQAYKLVKSFPSDASKVFLFHTDDIIVETPEPDYDEYSWQESHRWTPDAAADSAVSYPCIGSTWSAIRAGD